MKLGFKFLYALALLLAAGGFATHRAVAQETILDYNVDLVTDYVFRGIDVFRDVYISREAEETPFNVAPALQPSVSFYSPSGLWFNFWGSFALTDREDEDSPNSDTGDTFAGLQTLDELDTTIGYDWSNRLGSFSVGIVNFGLINPEVQGEDGSNIQEMFFSWGLPFMESLAPALSYNLDSDTANSYSTLSVGGGESLSWTVNLGYGSAGGAQGVQDVTGSIGFGFGGGLSVSANAAFRPTPQLVGYNSDGEYISQEDGSVADYPPAIAWIALSWGGELTE